jgi:hypothetical protein
VCVCVCAECATGAALAALSCLGFLGFSPFPLSPHTAVNRMSEKKNDYAILHEICYQVKCIEEVWDRQEFVRTLTGKWALVCTKAEGGSWGECCTKLQYCEDKEKNLRTQKEDTSIMVGRSNGQRDIGIPKPWTHGHQTCWLLPCVILSASYNVLVPRTWMFAHQIIPKHVSSSCPKEHEDK